jgi:hypothetical protein
MVTRRGRSVLWHTGTHDLTQEGEDVRAGGMLERSAIETSGWTPGRCEGATSGVNPPRLNDCGSRLPSYKLLFSAGPKGGLVVEPGTPDTARNEKRTFINCPLLQVDELTPGAWPKEPGKVDVNKLFGRDRTVTIKGGRTWRGVLGAGRAGATTTETKLTFTVKLKRVRSSGAARPASSRSNSASGRLPPVARSWPCANSWLAASPSIGSASRRTRRRSPSPPRTAKLTVPSPR